MRRTLLFDVVSLQRAMSGPISMDEATCGMAAGGGVQSGRVCVEMVVSDCVCVCSAAHAPLLSSGRQESIDDPERRRDGRFR